MSFLYLFGFFLKLLFKVELARLGAGEGVWRQVPLGVSLICLLSKGPDEPTPPSPSSISGLITLSVSEYSQRRQRLRPVTRGILAQT